MAYTYGNANAAVDCEYTIIADTVCDWTTNSITYDGASSRDLICSVNQHSFGVLYNDPEFCGERVLELYWRDMSG